MKPLDPDAADRTPRRLFYLTLAANVIVFSVLWPVALGGVAFCPLYRWTAAATALVFCWAWISPDDWVPAILYCGCTIFFWLAWILFIIWPRTFSMDGECV